MRRAILGAVVVLAAGNAGVALAQNGAPDLPRERELRLAMSAGPLSVSSAADVYVLGEHGFERVIEGSNGFACLVIRSVSNPEILAPHCLNPAAVETVLPTMLREGELQRQGLDGPAIDAELQRQRDAGELPLPAGPAYAYMLSAGQYLGAGVGNFRPHFMLYVPYLTNEAVGGDPRDLRFPFVGPGENHALSTLVIVMEEFVRPEDVVLPSGR